MEQIRSYLISIVCTALICGIAGKLFTSKGTSESIMKLIVGMIMTLALLQPFSGMDIFDFSDSFDLYSLDAERIVNSSMEDSRKSLKDGIKQRTEAYILDKASGMKANLSVRVEVSDDEWPIPKKVYLSGNVSPYVKSKLQSMITNDLGISKEHQQWN